MGWLKRRIIEDMEPKQEPPMSARERLFEIVYAGGEDAVTALHDYLESRAEMVDRVTDAFVKPRWIPVGERLPEIGVSVLCSSPERLGDDWVWIGQREEYDWYFPGANEMGTPTHWMPLPAPPTDAK